MIDKIIKGRRSISHFKKKEVSAKLIDSIIDAASYAPSSCNTQPWYFLIVNTEESKKKLNAFIELGYDYTARELKKKRFGKVYARFLDFFSKYGKFDEAPVYILVFSRPYDAKPLAQAVKMSKDKRISEIADESVKTSTAMAMQNLLLASYSKGLGTRVKDGIKFLLNFKKLKEKFYKEFRIPLDYKLISGIQMGWPAESKTAKKRFTLSKIRKYV